MKIPATLAALCLIALAAQAHAHPGHAAAPSSGAYLVFWAGAPPKAVLGPIAAGSAPGFWKRAFISKYRILGTSLPILQP
jgi:hypothetical protein